MPIVYYCNVNLDSIIIDNRVQLESTALLTKAIIKRVSPETEKKNKTTQYLYKYINRKAKRAE